MTNDLTKLSQFETTASELIITLTSELPAIVDDLETQFPATKIPVDLANKDEYGFLTSVIKKIKVPKIALEKDRKAIKGPVITVGKQIDDAAREYRERLEKLLKPWVAAKKAHDEEVELAKRRLAEEEEAVIDRIAVIKAIPGANIGHSATTILDVVNSLRDYDCEWAKKFDMQEKATTERDSAIASLLILHSTATMEEQQEQIALEATEKRLAGEEAARVKLAEDQAELKAAQDKMELEKKAVQDAAERVAKKEKAAAEAEAKLIRDQEQAITDAIVAKEQAERDEVARLAKVAENDRLVAEAKARQAEAEKQAKENHEGNVREAVQDLKALGINAADACVEAIINGEIRHIVWVD